MNWLRKTFFRLQPLFIKRKIEAELTDEIQTHLEMQTEANVAAGMSPEEARFAARRQFGGVDQIKEQYRDERGLPWIEDFGKDVRFAFRQLAKAPGFCAVAVLTIALGIGTCTAMFSVANGVLFRPLDLPHPDRLVNVSETDLPRYPVIGVTPGAYADWSDASTSFEHLAAFTWQYVNTTSLGGAQRFLAASVTANFVPTMGVQPILGRNFLPSEEVEGKNRVLLLQYDLWKQSFGGRSEVINQTLRLDDQIYTIIGVLPKMPGLFTKVMLYTPLASTAADRANYGAHELVCFGRLKTGISMAQAQSELTLLSDRIARQHPATSKGIGASVRTMREFMTGNVSLQLLTPWGPSDCSSPSPA